MLFRFPAPAADVPDDVAADPLYVIYNQLELINTLWSVGISYTTMNLAFCIWMLKGFLIPSP